MNLFFGTVVNNIEILQRILLVSDLAGNGVVSVEADCATDGLNKLLDSADIKKADVAVLCHQDMYFPPDFVETLKKRLFMLPESWIVAGLFGMNLNGEYCGRIHDRRSPLPLQTTHYLPTECLSIDACVMIFNLKKDFRFEKIEGFDLYDTYAVLRAREMGGTAWIIDCLADHYCVRSARWSPDAKFLKTWAWLKRRFPNGRIISTCYKD